MNSLQNIQAGPALAALLLFSFGALAALPPFIPLEKRAEEADIVIVGEITRVSTSGLNEASQAASVHIRLVEVLKGKKPPRAFSVNFLIFPDSVESQLRRPPKPGRYILFLNVQKVRDMSGRGGEALVLYRPHPFSYAQFTPANLRIVHAAVSRP